MSDAQVERNSTSVAPTGGGASRRLETTGDLFKQPTDWTRDGQTLLFDDLEGSTGYDIWKYPLTERSSPVPFLRSPYHELSARVSPDGRWIAYASEESGRREIYIQSFIEPGHKVRVSTGGGWLCWWMPGGSELVYLDLWRTPKTLMSVALHVAGEELEPGEPRQLCTLPAGTDGLDFSPDGKLILVSLPSGRDEATTVSLILNWAELVKP